MSNRNRSHAGHASTLITVLLTGTASLTPVAIAAEDGEQQLRQVREDCHVEAEAAGLRGAALEEFVEECIADLLSVRLHTISQD